jgi:hypothetical protein
VTAPRPARAPFDWEERGFALGETLDQYSALVVLGQDSLVAARVALGIGRAQAKRRRVAIGDLYGDAPPIATLITDDDPHGLVDSFVYGVSLNRIARRVPDAADLFIMPTGSDLPDYDEILPHPRWRRLAAGFKEAGALLLIIAPARAPRIEALVASTEGAIVAGQLPADASVAPVIGVIREPRSAAPRMRIETPQPPAWKNPRVAASLGILITAIVAAIVAWLAYRPLASSERPNQRKGVTDTAAARLIGAVRDSVEASVPAVTNPTDSANAAAYSVELATANTQAGAILKVRGDSGRPNGRTLPAGTFAPVLIRGARWFKVYAGAYAERSSADSLAGWLRTQGMLDSVAGVVVRVPFAFLIESDVPVAAVAGMVTTYADRGQPVYALRQANGSARLYAGAFEFPEQAVLFAESLRAAGLTPVLVYRTGRVF